tara:strand:+ start:514 stop:723 length:210 start_codon:yes stop_codon:yes gene_type:complete
MDISNQLTSLQNFANSFEDLKVKLFFNQDKRKKPKFVLTKNDTFISPALNYDKLNHFLLGIMNCKKYDL